MVNKTKREFWKGQELHVVDYWGTNKGSQAFATSAQIVNVNEEKETFDAVLYGDTYQTYSFKDYKRLFFDRKEDAQRAVENLPIPTSSIYQIIGRKVYKKKVIGIGARDVDGAIDLIVHLNRGKDVSIKEIGKSLFLDEAEARKNNK